ncbi:hypothetical protein HYZ05_00040 [Candidatus Daviesbacteria bacterium]|nr:hypothetical protein [Candidatus Daviesbacteria bacterium]
MGRPREFRTEEFPPFTEEEAAHFKGDPKLSRAAIQVQERFKQAQVVEQIKWLTFLRGKRPSVQELSSTFQLSQRTLDEIIRKEKLQAIPLPQARKESLPDNEAAFFRGLSLGRLEFHSLNWSGHRYVTVGTESADNRKHTLLRATFGKWGEVRGSETQGSRIRKKTRIYLDNGTFAFLLEEGSVGSSILLSHLRYPPFLLGLMVIKLLDAKDRLSLDNPQQLESIYRNCERHLGIPLGRFHIEKRPEGRLGVVEIKHPEEIFAALAQVETVSKLPYFRQNSFPNSLTEIEAGSHVSAKSKGWVK